MKTSILNLSLADASALYVALHGTTPEVATWRYLRPRTRLERVLRGVCARRTRQVTRCPRYISVI